MADFNTSGIEGLELSLEELAGLPEDILQQMLEAEGEVLRAAQARKIAELGLVESHQLERSITVNKKMRVNKRSGGMERYITVYPKGERTAADGSKRSTGRRHKKKRGGGMESVHAATNGEVGFVNEYGAPQRGLKPAQWMRTANEEAAEDAVSAAARVYDAWLKEKGL